MLASAVSCDQNPIVCVCYQGNSRKNRALTRGISAPASAAASTLPAAAAASVVILDVGSSIGGGVSSGSISDDSFTSTHGFGPKLSLR